MRVSFLVLLFAALLNGNLISSAQAGAVKFQDFLNQFDGEKLRIYFKHKLGEPLSGVLQDKGTSQDRLHLATTVDAWEKRQWENQLWRRRDDETLLGITPFAAEKPIPSRFGDLNFGIFASLHRIERIESASDFDELAEGAEIEITLNQRVHRGHLLSKSMQTTSVLLENGDSFSFQKISEITLKTDSNEVVALTIPWNSTANFSWKILKPAFVPQEGLLRRIVDLVEQISLLKDSTDLDEEFFRSIEIQYREKNWRDAVYARGIPQPLSITPDGRFYSVTLVRPSQRNRYAERFQFTLTPEGLRNERNSVLDEVSLLSPLDIAKYNVNLYAYLKVNGDRELVRLGKPLPEGEIDPAFVLLHAPLLLRPLKPGQIVRWDADTKFYTVLRIIAPHETGSIHWKVELSKYPTSLDGTVDVTVDVDVRTNFTLFRLLTEPIFKRDCASALLLNLIKI